MSNEVTPRTVEDRLAELEKWVAGLAQPPPVPLPAMQPTYPHWPGGRWEWIPDSQPHWQYPWVVTCGTATVSGVTQATSSDITRAKS